MAINQLLLSDAIMMIETGCSQTDARLLVDARGWKKIIR